MSQLKRLSVTKAFFKITLFFGKFLGLSLWDILYYVTTTFSRFLKDVFWIILEIRYLLLRSNYVHKYDLITLRVRFSFSDFFVWNVCIMYWCYVLLLFSLWDVFYYVKITLFICSMCLRFLTTLELRYILLYLNYVWK